MSGEKVIAVFVKTPQDYSVCHMNWPTKKVSLSQGPLLQTAAIAYPHGLKITYDGNQTYLVTFLFKEPHGLYYYTSIQFPITFADMVNFEKLDEKEKVIEFYSRFSKERLGKHCKWQLFGGNYDDFSLEVCFGQGEKYAKIRVMGILYSAMLKDMRTRFAWLCVATLHLRQVPKDVRKLICSHI